MLHIASLSIFVAPARVLAPFLSPQQLICWWCFHLLSFAYSLCAFALCLWRARAIEALFRSTEVWMKECISGWVFKMLRSCGRCSIEVWFWILHEDIGVERAESVVSVFYANYFWRFCRRWNSLYFMVLIFNEDRIEIDSVKVGIWRVLVSEYRFQICIA